MAGLTEQQLINMGAKPIMATPQTPQQIQQSIEPSFTPQVQGGLTEQQLIEAGAKPISIQPERTPEQTQQIIQQGIQEPEQRIVPGERIELPEDAGFIKRGVVGLGNFFGLSQAADIAARTITEGENKKLKDQIVNEANQRISTYQQLIQNAQGRNDTARANRLTGQLVDDIQRINDLIG